jgi:hypothetical protein
MHTIVLYPAKLPSLTYHHPHHRSYEMVTQIYADREDNFTLVCKLQFADQPPLTFPLP